MSIHTKLYSPLFQNIVRLIVKPVLRTCFSISVYGLENIPHDEPVIIAANHIKAIDSFVMGINIGGLHFAMGKEEYCFNPILKHLLTALGTFPVARKNKYATLQKCYSKEKLEEYLLSELQFNYDKYFPIAYRNEILFDMKKTLFKTNIPNLATLSPLTIASYLLMKNETLLIHVEGTRHADGVISGCKPGIAKIVLDLQERYGKPVSIIPCTVRYEEPFGFRSKVYVKFGNKIDYSEYAYNLSKNTAESISGLTKLIENNLIVLYNSQ